MKFLRYISIVLIPCLMMSTVLFTSCEQDGNGQLLDTPDGPPAIDYIRVPNPAASDSLLERAQLGTGIVLVGSNLGGVRQIFFNDLEATLIPTWVTNRTIFVDIPGTPPVDVTDKIYLKDGNGNTLLEHDFIVDIAPPRIDRLKSEWIPAGADLVIEGNFFFEPITVTLPGGAEAEITSLEQQTIRIAVPEDTESGQITVKTNFGTAVSKQLYKDNRGIFGTMEPDDYDGNLWHREAWFSSEIETPEVPNVNGYYIRMNTKLSGGGWDEWFVGNQSQDPNALNPINILTQNIPGDAFVNPSLYSLKFEMITVEPTDAKEGWYMYIGDGSMGDRRTKEENGTTVAYQWTPGVVDTGGEWETMVIPFADVLKNNKSKPSAIGYGFSFFFWKFQDDMTVNCAIDNIRVVPN